MFDLRMYGNEIKEIVKFDGIEYRKYEIEEIFQYHAKCRDEFGNVECFSVGDLITMGALHDKFLRL